MDEDDDELFEQALLQPRSAKRAASAAGGAGGAMSAVRALCGEAREEAGGVRDCDSEVRGGALPSSQDTDASPDRTAGEMTSESARPAKRARRSVLNPELELIRDAMDELRQKTRLRHLRWATGYADQDRIAIPVRLVKNTNELPLTLQKKKNYLGYELRELRKDQSKTLAMVFRLKGALPTFLLLSAEDMKSSLPFVPNDANDERLGEAGREAARKAKRSKSGLPKSQRGVAKVFCEIHSVFNTIYCEALERETEIAHAEAVRVKEAAALAMRVAAAAKKDEKSAGDKPKGPRRKCLQSDSRHLLVLKPGDHVVALDHKHGFVKVKVARVSCATAESALPIEIDRFVNGKGMLAGDQPVERVVPTPLARELLGNTFDSSIEYVTPKKPVSAFRLEEGFVEGEALREQIANSMAALKKNLQKDKFGFAVA